MAKEFFKDLPDTTTPLTASRLNGLLDGEEALGNLVVDSIRSKNMFDKNNVETGKYYSTSSISTSENWCISQIPIKPNTNYYLSGNNYNNQTAHIVLLDSGKNIIQDLGGYKNVHSIATTSSSAYIGLSIANYSGNSDLDSIMVEKGEIGTPYFPYQNLDGKETYSTGETVIGTWLGKPLYRKVIEDTIPSTTTGVVNTKNINIDNNIKIIKFNGYFDIYSSQNRPIPWVQDSNQSVQIYNNYSSNYLNIRTSMEDASNCKIVIIIEYTKTTD